MALVPVLSLVGLEDFPPAENVLKGVHCIPKGLDMIVQNLINPFTAPACKTPGLKKCAHALPQTAYLVVLSQIDFPYFAFA